MSGGLINLLIQIIVGAIGGNAAGAAMKDASLGTAGNSIAGAIGGVAGGQLLQSMMPALLGAAGNMDIGTIVSQAAGGGIAGAIVTAIVGQIKAKMA